MLVWTANLPSKMLDLVPHVCYQETFAGKGSKPPSGLAAVVGQTTLFEIQLLPPTVVRSFGEGTHFMGMATNKIRGETP
jgi:hypothetical protein